MSKFYYIKHPNHIQRYFESVPDPPIRYKLWELSRLHHPDIPEKLITFIIGLNLLSALIFFIKLFSGIFDYKFLIPIILLILLILFSYSMAIFKYLKDQYKMSKKNKSYPKDCQTWINSLAPGYITYIQYLTRDYEYLFNSTTTQGRTANNLRLSLECLGLNAKQEAYLKWRGLNNLPKRPYHRKKDTKSYWYDQFKFTADFVIVNKDYGVMMDIEIDESFHFVDERKIQKDEKRNLVFLFNGWSIIRFTDDCVISDASICAADIQMVFNQIKTMHNDIIQSLSNLKFNESLDKNDYTIYVLDDLKNKKVDWLENILIQNDVEKQKCIYFPSAFRYREADFLIDPYHGQYFKDDY